MVLFARGFPDDAGPFAGELEHHNALVIAEVLLTTTPIPGTRLLYDLLRAHPIHDE